MIGRRTTVGLSLLCALLFSAIAVQSAAGAVSNNTTAVTCVKEKGNLDFSDEHCDTFVGIGKGKYGHIPVAAANGTSTEVEVSNKTTGGATSPAKFFGEPFKVQTEIECTTAAGTGTATNIEEPAGSKNHRIVGKGSSSFSGCTVKKPAKCTVKEPITVNADVVGVDELEGKKEMGGESKPEGGGKTLSTITLLNKGAEACALNGKPFNVEGTAIATSGPTGAANTNKWSGATVVYTKAMTEKTLKAAEKFAWFEATTTVRMKGGEPIALTTTT